LYYCRNRGVVWILVARNLSFRLRWLAAATATSQPGPIEPERYFSIPWFNSKRIAGTRSNSAIGPSTPASGFCSIPDHYPGLLLSSILSTHLSRRAGFGGPQVQVALLSSGSWIAAVGREFRVGCFAGWDNSSLYNSQQQSAFVYFLSFYPKQNR